MGGGNPLLTLKNNRFSLLPKIKGVEIHTVEVKNYFKCWGVFREKEHSPEREADDEAILLSVAEKLKFYQYIDIKTFLPHELTNEPSSLPDLVFYMCEKEEILARLEKWKEKSVIMVNEPQGVRNTLRHNMLKILSHKPFFPRSQIISTQHILPEKDFKNVWVKRGDYHAVCDKDVQYVRDRSSLLSIIEGFKKRKISSVMVQEHVQGDLIKFYGVRDNTRKESYWFYWFYHKNQEVHKYTFVPDSLQLICENCADLIGVEVYGGDVIVTPQGEIFLIDLNAWPSFSLYRQEAARHIASCIAQKVLIKVAEVPCSSGGIFWDKHHINKTRNYTVEQE
jgi:glutathione synthase/RimK-type ligase-like ATP-grasp enzyme